jgi:uncharacterized SAM-binding protein YcdF (DUF218 family)
MTVGIDVESLTSAEYERRRRVRRLTLVVGSLVVAVLLVVGVKVYVYPDQEVPDRADAIIVLGGFGTKPIHKGFALATEGVADTVVVSDPYDPNTTISRDACAETHDFEVLCFRPNPNTTQGEARQIRVLMEERGWDTVVVVTARYHVSRARVIVGRCVPTGVSMVAATTPTGLDDWAYNFFYQTAGFVKLVFTSGC